MHTSCNMKCGRLKRRDERKKTLGTRFYPVVPIATKAPLHSRCWSTHEEYRFLAIKSLPWTESRSPWSWSSLREIAHGGGVSVPCTMLSTPLHTKPEGRWHAGKPRPGRSVNTEPIGSVLWYHCKFSSSKIGTDRFLKILGTEEIWYR